MRAGSRALALRSDKGVDLRSRRNRPLNNRFANLARALAVIEPATVLDGEIIVLDEDGRPSFNLLQNYQTSSRSILYHVFDLLVYHGRSLLQVPLHKRREILRDIALRGTGDPIRLSPIFDAAASDLVAAAQEQRIEGIIAKRVNSVYEPGR